MGKGSVVVDIETGEPMQNVEHRTHVMSDSHNPEKKATLGERLSLPWMCDICGKPRRNGSH